METMMEWLPIGFVCGGIGALVFWLAPRVYTFLRAVTSGWKKDNVEGRLAICRACPRVKEKVHVDQHGKEASYLYCDECKCGSHHLAELNVKLGFNHLKCPIGKWGPAVAMDVHEAHDMLIDRGKKEREKDMQERRNIMAGRDRDDNGPTNGPLGNVQTGPVQLGEDRTARALELQRQSAAKQKKQAQLARSQEELRQRQIDQARAAAGTKTDAPADKDSVWGDRQSQAALAGVDHVDDIHVDQEKNDGGQTLDKRGG